MPLFRIQNDIVSLPHNSVNMVPYKNPAANTWFSRLSLYVKKVQGSLCFIQGFYANKAESVTGFLSLDFFSSFSAKNKLKRQYDNNTKDAIAYNLPT